MIEKFFRPYAKALLESAGAENAPAVREELGRLSQAINEVPLLLRTASNPGVPAEVKRKAMAEIAASLEMGPLAESFAQLLLKNYRLEYLEGILGVVDEILNERVGRLKARVSSAHPLNDGQQQELKSTLEKKFGRQIDLELSVDPSLLGGFIAVLGSDRYDTSLKGQLDRLAGQMAQSG